MTQCSSRPRITVTGTSAYYNRGNLKTGITLSKMLCLGIKGGEGLKEPEGSKGDQNEAVVCSGRIIVGEGE
jgi:hypothetical protein